MLYKGPNCAPCARLQEYLDDKDIKPPTLELSFDDLRAGNYSFRTVPSLVLESGEVISGFPKIRLFFSKRI